MEKDYTNLIKRIQRLKIVWENIVPYSERPKITSSKDVYEIIKLFYTHGSIGYKESFWLILMNRANKIQGIDKVSEGGITGTVADPRIIFHTALLAKSTSIICVHNHPSGNVRPSPHDIELTNRIEEIGNLLDIRLLDHLIVTNEKYFSFADKGMITNYT